MKNLKAFLSQHPPPSGQWEAYVSLTSKLSLADVARQLSQVMDVRMNRSDAFDECDAYLGSIHDHDVTVLIPRDEAEKGEFQIMLEPGQDCLGKGGWLNLSEELEAWLISRVGGIGEFSLIG